MKIRKLFFAVTAMAVMVVNFAQAVDKTFVGASDWNLDASWSPSGIPSGTDNVIIPLSKYARASKSTVPLTPTYSGTLFIGSNSTVECGSSADVLENFNALGTAGSTIITMQQGAQIVMRGAFSPNIPAIVLTGDVRMTIGTSNNGAPTPVFSYGITGAYVLSLEGKGGASVTINTVGNTCSALVVQPVTATGFTLNANVAGALGTGDVTIRAAQAGTIGANLVLGAANAIASTATLSLYGPNSATKLKLTVVNTVKRLVVDGVTQAPGVYGKTGSGAQYPVSWIDATSTAFLTVTGAPTQYWDLDGSTAGAGSTAGDASGTWNAGNAFWNNAVGTGTATAWTLGQAAVFAAGTDASGTYAVTVSGQQDIGGLGFEEGTVTLSGDGLRMTSDSELVVASGATGTVSSVIANDSARKLIKVGAGTLTLSGTSTYTGITQVDQGILSVASLANAGTDSSIGNYPTSGAGGLLIGGGTFRYTGGNAMVTRGFSVAGNGSIDIQSSSTTLTMGDVESINQPSTLTVTGGAGSSLTIGRARIVQAAQLTLNPTTANMTVGTINGYTAYNQTSIITLGGTATNNVVTGVISVTPVPGSISDILNLVKANSSTWTLNGTSTYGGTTTINAGVLEAKVLANGGSSSSIGNSGNAAASLVFGAPAATLRYVGTANVTIDRGFTLSSGIGGGAMIESSGSGTLSINNTAALAYGTAAQTRLLTLGGSNTGTNTFSKVIGNNTTAATSVTKAGPGKWILSAQNTYSGDTTVSEGTLSLGNGTANSSLSDYATLAVASGAVLNLNYSGQDSVLYLNLGGSPAAAGEWGAVSSGAANESALITGTGRINNLTGILVNEYFWDGGTTNIAVNGNLISAGGAGTWNSTIQNWDKGLTAHAAWGNTTSDSAVFGGTAGTVTLGESVTISNLTINSDYYTIQSNTLNFATGGRITVNSALNSNWVTVETFRSAISGAPAVALNIVGANNETIFAPESGASSLGTISGAGLIQLAGSTTGNTVAGAGSNKIRVTGGEWTLLGNANAFQHWVNAGTLIVGVGARLTASDAKGINLSTNATLIVNGTVGAGTASGVLFTGSNEGAAPWNVVRPGGTLKGTGIVNQTAALTAVSGATIAPGYPTGTLTITNCDCTINGKLAITVNGSQNSTLAMDPAKFFTLSSATLDVNVTATPITQLTIATYGVGKLTGTFASNNMPPGWTIDYAANGGKAIVLTPPAAGTIILLR